MHEVCSVPRRLKKAHTMVNQKSKPLGGKSSPFYQRNFRFYCFSFSWRAYLHHQKKEQNRCHSSQIYSLGFGLILRWRTCSGCCAARAGPSRRSPCLRNCIRPSCTAALRKAVPRTQSQVTPPAKSYQQRIMQSCVSCLRLLNCLQKLKSAFDTTSLYILLG